MKLQIKMSIIYRTSRNAVLLHSRFIELWVNRKTTTNGPQNKSAASSFLLPDWFEEVYLRSCGKKSLCITHYLDRGNRQAKLLSYPAGRSTKTNRHHLMASLPQSPFSSFHRYGREARRLPAPNKCPAQ